MLLKVFRPNLIDYINLSKVLDNYTRNRGWDWLMVGGGGASVFV